MASDIDLCNQALDFLGAEAIHSFTDEDDNARRCGRVYPALRKSYLSKYPWRFALKRVELSREASAPAGGGWEYSFVLPPDRASHGAFGAFQSGGSYEPAFADWQILGNRLLANVERVWVEYAYRVGEAEFPEYFSEFLAAALCSRLAFAVTDQQNTAMHWERVAFGQDGASGLYLEAQIADSQQHPTPMLRGDYDLIVARFG